MVTIFRVLAVAAFIYNAWVIFRVVDDWLGMFATIGSIVVFPISLVLIPFVMLFVWSSEAGALALWPAIILVGILDWLARKNGSSLLLK